MEREGFKHTSLLLREGGGEGQVAQNKIPNTQEPALLECGWIKDDDRMIDRVGSL